jgi:hypothetical protein
MRALDQAQNAGDKVTTRGLESGGEGEYAGEIEKFGEIKTDGIL